MTQQTQLNSDLQALEDANDEYVSNNKHPELVENTIDGRELEWNAERYSSAPEIATIGISHKLAKAIQNRFLHDTTLAEQFLMEVTDGLKSAGHYNAHGSWTHMVNAIDVHVTFRVYPQ